MIYTTAYNSPIGKIYLSSLDNRLICLSINDNDDYLKSFNEEIINGEEDILIKTKTWLDRYFNHQKPNSSELDMYLKGTDYQRLVWQMTMDIPYGEVVTYGEIAKKIGDNRSARAVGGALNKNPIPVIIPCHRVVGVKGLVGYGYGLEMKKKLLEIEKDKGLI